MSLNSPSIPSPITLLLKVLSIRLCHLRSNKSCVYAFRGVSYLQGNFLIVDLFCVLLLFVY